MSATTSKTSLLREKSPSHRTRRSKAKQHTKYQGRIERPIERTTSAKEDHQRFSRCLAHFSATNPSDGHDAFRSSQLPCLDEAISPHTSPPSHSLLCAEPSLLTLHPDPMTDVAGVGWFQSNGHDPYPSPSPSAHSAGAWVPSALGIGVADTGSSSSSPSSTGYTTASSSPPLPALLTTPTQPSTVDAHYGTSSYPSPATPGYETAWSDIDVANSKSSSPSPEIYDPGTSASLPCATTRGVSKSSMDLRDWGRHQEEMVGCSPDHLGPTSSRSLLDSSVLDPSPHNDSSVPRSCSPWRSNPLEAASRSGETDASNGFASMGPFNNSTSSAVEYQGDDPSSSTTALTVWKAPSSVAPPTDTPDPQGNLAKATAEDETIDVPRRLAATSIAVGATYHRIGCHLVAVLDLIEDLVTLDRLQQELTSKLYKGEHNGGGRAQSDIPSTLRDRRVAAQSRYPRFPFSSSLPKYSDSEIQVMGQDFSVNPMSLGPDIQERWAATC